MIYGFWDKEEGVLGRVKEGFVCSYEKIEKPMPGSIFRVEKGKRLDFLEANEIDLGFEQALLFDRQALDGPSKNRLLVQYRSGPYDGKKAMVTEKILLKGTYIILDPNSDFVSVSRKIIDEEERKKFRDAFKDKKYGLIVRTRAEGSLDKALAEYRDLEEEYDRILASLDFNPLPKLLYQPQIDFSRVFEGAEKVYTNDINLKKNYSGPIDYDRSYSLNKDTQLVKNMEDAQKRTVEFSGADFVVDSLEALTVIDINSGRVKARPNKASNADYVNQLLIKPILSQLVLRQIGGIVLIDFIRTGHRLRKKLKENFIKESKSYDLSIKSLSFTKAGLFELVIAR